MNRIQDLAWDKAAEWAAGGWKFRWEVERQYGKGILTLDPSWEIRRQLWRADLEGAVRDRTVQEISRT
jgi:hypothetical protein